MKKEITLKEAILEFENRISNESERLCSQN